MNKFENVPQEVKDLLDGLIYDGEYSTQNGWVVFKVMTRDGDIWWGSVPASEYLTDKMYDPLDPQEDFTHEQLTKIEQI